MKDRPCKNKTFILFIDQIEMLEKEGNASNRLRDIIDVHLKNVKGLKVEAEFKKLEYEIFFKKAELVRKYKEEYFNNLSESAKDDLKKHAESLYITILLKNYEDKEAVFNSKRIYFNTTHNLDLSVNEYKEALEKIGGKKIE